MKKGDKLNSKYGNYQITGTWNGAWILSPVSETETECLAYTTEELVELIGIGEFKRV